MTLPPLAERTLQRLIRTFSPDKVLLFGSYAKGTQHAFSDVDFLVIGNFRGSALSLKQRARQISSDCFPPVDVVFATPEEVADANLQRSPFLMSVVGKGVVVYEK
jgi:predicted nucleotidyltransferase